MAILPGFNFGLNLPPPTLSGFQTIGAAGLPPQTLTGLYGGQQIVPTPGLGPAGAANVGNTSGPTVRVPGLGPVPPTPSGGGGGGDGQNEPGIGEMILGALPLLGALPEDTLSGLGDIFTGGGGEGGGLPSFPGGGQILQKLGNALGIGGGAAGGFTSAGLAGVPVGGPAFGGAVDAIAGATAGGAAPGGAGGFLGGFGPALGLAAPLAIGALAFMNKDHSNFVDTPLPQGVGVYNPAGNQGGFSRGRMITPDDMVGEYLKAAQQQTAAINALGLTTDQVARIINPIGKELGPQRGIPNFMMQQALSKEFGEDRGRKLTEALMGPAAGLSRTQLKQARGRAQQQQAQRADRLASGGGGGR